MYEYNLFIWRFSPNDKKLLKKWLNEVKRKRFTFVM